MADAFSDRSCSIRPGLLIGPHDPTERFSKWVRALAGGGRVRAPAAREQPVQLIDARDLAEWMLAGVEQGRTGAFNATGPSEPLTLGETLERVRNATGNKAELGDGRTGKSPPTPDALALSREAVAQTQNRSDGRSVR